MATDSYTPAPQYAGDGQPAPRHGAGMATTALVLGILALLTSLTVIGGILLGLGAVIFGFIGLRRAKVGAPGKGRAITGIVLGVIGIVISAVLIAVGAAFWNSDTVQNYRQCVDNANSNQQQIQACAQEFGQQVENQTNNN